MNIKNLYKCIVYVIFIVLIFSFQVAFLGNFNRFLANFNLIVACLVILISLANYRSVLFFSLVSGFLMDIYSGLPFGIFLGTFFVMSIILEILFRNFFTNHSYYSLISMGLISVIIYNIVFFTMQGFLYVIGAVDFMFGSNFWLNFFYQMIAMVIILSVSFSVINSISKKYKPIFLKS